MNKNAISIVPTIMTNGKKTETKTSIKVKYTLIYDCLKLTKNTVYCKGTALAIAQMAQWTILHITPP